MLIALDLLLLCAVLFYSGALASIGAIVAPLVFRSGWDGAGGVMTKIFLRFDRVAMVLVFVALGTELLRVVLFPVRKPSDERQDQSTPQAENSRPIGVLRFALVCAFAFTVGAQSGYLSPQIARMYEQGISPRHPQFGQQFSSVHRTSSAVGKASVVLAIAIATVVLKSLRGPRVDREKNQQTAIDAPKTTA